MGLIFTLISSKTLDFQSKKRKRKKRQNRLKREKFYETMCASKTSTCSVAVLFASLKCHQELDFSGTL